MQLMDITDSHQMNFHSFVLLFGLMSKTTLQERLKLLYILHRNQLLNSRSASKQDVDAGESSKELVLYPDPSMKKLWEGLGMR